MMQVSRAKRIVAMVLAAGAAVGLTATLLSAGFIVLSSGSGADPADAFQEIPVVPERLDELVTWLPDRELIRQVEPDTRSLLESTWVRSWQRVDTAERSNDRELIDTWYLPGLAQHVAITTGNDQASSIRQLEHIFDVTFYSLDGSVLGATIESALERQIEDGPTLRSRDRFEVVFLLSDGNWRVQHLTLLPSTEA